MKARVYKSTGSHYSVKDEHGRFWNARIRGRFKIDKSIRATNPIAVGDWVNIIIENEDDGKAIINQIDKRKNYIIREAPQNRIKRHIVAANLDEAIVIATINNPRTSHGFIDRFLLTAEAYHLPASIIFNKADLITEEYIADWKILEDLYQKIGYSVFTIQATVKEDIDKIRQHLKGKTTLFSGHSGVGKSTIVNELFPNLNLKTLAISSTSGKGQHSTTFAEMFDLDDNSQIIDTPGVKEFGIIDIDRYELAHYFPEMKALLPECKFNNCLHVNEPECAVKDALEISVSILRYESYLNILDSLPQAEYL
ncbi:MAG TPA: ribosome small subunit-dependent GTPase A [Edaphocola sp.]|nr:ribosome small subunit-dependent GTPase A [Edaphocola sp.]